MKKNLYEGMYIISATLSEEARGKALDRISKGITEKKGEVLKVHNQGKKRLAYEIDGHKEGYYFILYFDLPPTDINELWSEYHLNEDLLRFMTTRTENVLETIEFKSLQVEE
jgi:small subunit ribosomal protein S6